MVETGRARVDKQKYRIIVKDVSMVPANVISDLMKKNRSLILFDNACPLSNLDLKNHEHYDAIFPAMSLSY